jgi:branched-chain amino acid transport system substrate-binding protein
MKRRFLLASLLATSIVTPSHAEIKIGFMATFSGPQGLLGQDMFDGFMLGVARAGDTLGGQKVAIIKADDQSKPDVATQLATKLIQSDHVPIIVGITGSNIMMAVHHQITDAGVILIGTVAGPTPITGASCSVNFFSTSWNNESLHESMGAFATSAGYKKVFAIAGNTQAGIDAVNGFKRLYKLPLANEIYPEWNQVDYVTEIGEIQAAQPDAVYAFLPGGMGINFVKQYQQAGLLGKIPLISTSTIDGTTLPALKSTALGAITGGSYSPDLDNKANQEFAAEFVKKYGREPSLYAAQSYDAARLLDSALQKVGGDVSKINDFRAALKAADFASVTGDFRYNTNHFPIRDFYRIDIGLNKSGQASLLNKGVVLHDHPDDYAAQCPIKD